MPQSAVELLSDFDAHYEAIKKAERDLYSAPDRHLESAEIKLKESSLNAAIEAFLDNMPRVFDPFAGGGAIPLEASRLGCRAYGNDINPVAHIIQKGSLEFPQKYGKPIIYSRDQFLRKYGEEEFEKIVAENPLLLDKDAVKIENRLAFDVEFYAKELLKRAEIEIGHFYPADENGKKPIAYYWARVGTCSNPSCRAEVPLLKGFYLVNKPEKKVYLKPIIDGNKIDFEIKKGDFYAEGWMTSRALICPCCGSSTATTEIKRQANEKDLKEKLIAVIEDSEKGKTYRTPTKKEKQVSQIDGSLLNPLLIPNETMLKIPDLVSGRGWGINKWSQMFSPRQLLAMQTLTQEIKNIQQNIDIENDYGKAIATYLGILIDKIIVNNTSFGRWNISVEALAHPFSKQAIPMIFDYPESQVFGKVAGAAINQLEWLLRYVETESSVPFPTILQNASSGERGQFAEKSITSVVTDPPYYDAIAYADLSDFFYVWLKRTLADIYPTNFATPQTPKSEECTALKYRHEASVAKAKQHFEKKLLQIFDAIEHQTSDVVSIMFAHQSTEAWTTLCNSILRAKLNIAGSWAIDTERPNRTLALDSAALESSVTVSCKPIKRKEFGDYQTVKRDIERKVAEEVELLYKLGFRGSDLLTACFGKAVSVFGEYENVEKADGSSVSVEELLKTTRASALNALVKNFDGDDFTKFYLAWLQMYGFIESNHNESLNFVRAGLSIEHKDLVNSHIFIKNGKKESLARFEERYELNRRLGETPNAPLIDRAHKAIWLYKNSNRESLLNFLRQINAVSDAPFWRVLTSLEELTKGTDEFKQISGLLGNKENLIRDSKKSDEISEQQNLFSENLRS